MPWTSPVLDLLSITSVMSYYYINEYPLWTYGENINNFIQTFIILFFIYKYKGISLKIFLSFITLLVLIASMVLANKLPMKLVSIMFSSSSLLYCISRFMTVWNIWKIKYSGAVSSITAFCSFAGLFARFISILEEFKSGDKLLMTTMSFQVFFSGLLFLFSIMYSKQPVQKKNK